MYYDGAPVVTPPTTDIKLRLEATAILDYGHKLPTLCYIEMKLTTVSPLPQCGLDHEFPALSFSSTVGKSNDY